MKTLTAYAKNGRTWKVTNRDGDVAMAMSGPHFEVFVVQRHQGREIAGKFFPPAEYAPSNEQWGRLGWSFSDAEQASRKFYVEAKSQREGKKD